MNSYLKILYPPPVFPGRNTSDLERTLDRGTVPNPSYSNPSYQKHIETYVREYLLVENTRVENKNPLKS